MVDCCGKEETNNLKLMMMVMFKVGNYLITNCWVSCSGSGALAGASYLQLTRPLALSTSITQAAGARQPDSFVALSYPCQSQRQYVPRWIKWDPHCPINVEAYRR